jgi:hypothetical protein
MLDGIRILLTAPFVQLLIILTSAAIAFVALHESNR